MEPTYPARRLASVITGYGAAPITGVVHDLGYKDRDGRDRKSESLARVSAETTLVPRRPPAMVGRARGRRQRLDIVVPRVGPDAAYRARETDRRRT